MVLLGDTPYIAGRGTPVRVGGVEFSPDNVFDVRVFYPQLPARGGAFVGTGPDAPVLGEVGGTPYPHQPAVGTPLWNGYRVIVEPEGVGRVTLVTTFPE